MPTGYTADVQNGKITEFRDFALTCARAFGALIMMRDDPHDAPIPDAFRPNTTYDDRRIAEAEAVLTELPHLSVAECERRAVAAHADALDSHNQYRRNNAEVRQRYEAMLVKVNAWTPPTVDHEELKNFMVSQLQQSVDFDCSDKYVSPEPSLQSGEEWRNAELTKAASDLARAVKSREEEITRTNNRNRWIAALRSSLANT